MNSSSREFLCPACRVQLVMSERQGIEIDYCPQCRGVWLDRGELDKIIERNASHPSLASAPPPSAWTQPGSVPMSSVPRPPEPARYRDDDDDGRRHGDQRRRKSSWLGELFD